MNDDDDDEKLSIPPGSIEHVTLESKSAMAERITILGHVIRDAKRAGQPRSVWDKSLQEMLQWKQQYQTTFGKSYTPPHKQELAVLRIWNNVGHNDVHRKFMSTIPPRRLLVNVDDVHKNKNNSIIIEDIRLRMVARRMQHQELPTTV